MADYEHAFSRVDKEEDYIVDVLKRILAVDTTVPPGENYGRLIDAVEPEFSRLGFETKRIVVPEDKVRSIAPDLTGERQNLVANLKNGKPRASAYAHMDVVPVDETWTRDPFGGELVDGKLYGRGTVDMKGSIACFLGALKVLHDLGQEPNYDIDCFLCTDEEIGVYPGARYLAEEGFFSNHLVWLELGAVDPVFIIGAAGAVRIDMTSCGKSCHSGMNYLGINAIEELVPIMTELLALKKDVEKRLSKIPAFPIPGNPYDKMTPMFNLNIIHGGTKDNVVPAECRLTINRRYIIEERYEDVVQEIRSAVAKGRERSKLLDLKMEFTNLYPPVMIDPETEAARRAKAAARAVKGHEDFLMGGISASTDLGFVVEALKPNPVEVAAFGPIRVGDLRAHMADEFVFVEDLIAMTKELVYYFGF